MIFAQTVDCWGSQCFLSVSAWLGCCVRLPGLVCQSCLPACLPSGLRCCVRLSRLAFASLGCLSAQAICYWSSLRWPCWAYCVSLVAGLVPHLVFQLVWGSVSAFLGLSGMLVSALFSFAQLSLSPVLSSSWSGMSCMSVLCACLQISGGICAAVRGLPWWLHSGVVLSDLRMWKIGKHLFLATGNTCL